MEKQEIIKLQIKSILLAHYITYFTKLEKTIKQIFQRRIVEKEHKYKSKLYFAYGCVVGNDLFYDFDKECISLIGNRKYSDTELFNNLNINKIIKFDRKEHIIDDFQLNINSMQSKHLSFSFHDSVLKLIKMRNKLAHELNEIDFDNKDIIEKLSLKFISDNRFEWLDGLDVNMMEDESIDIYSNLIYMLHIIELLSNRESQ